MSYPSDPAACVCLHQRHKYAQIDTSPSHCESALDDLFRPRIFETETTNFRPNPGKRKKIRYPRHQNQPSINIKSSEQNEGEKKERKEFINAQIPQEPE